MWSLGAWFCDVLGSVRFTVGLDDLQGLFRAKWFYDSVAICKPRINLVWQRCIVITLVHLQCRCSSPILHKKSAAQGKIGISYMSEPHTAVHANTRTYTTIQILSPKPLHRSPNPLWHWGQHWNAFPFYYLRTRDFDPWDSRSRKCPLGSLVHHVLVKFAEWTPLVKSAACEFDGLEDEVCNWEYRAEKWLCLFWLENEGGEVVRRTSDIFSPTPSSKRYFTSGKKSPCLCESWNTTWWEKVAWLFDVQGY